MSFPGLIASGFTAIEDSQYFMDVPVDGALKFEMQGGLVVSRKRFTRAPARIITTGYTWMTQSDYALFQAYWTLEGGGANSFTYTHPITAESLTVRFDKEYKAVYKGAGSNYLWDVTEITLRQA